MFKTAVLMLWVERKKSYNLILSIIVCICVSFIFTQFFYNSNIMGVMPGEYVASGAALGFTLSPMLTFWMLALCMCLLSYAYNYYIIMHAQEIGLLKLSGYTVLQIFQYQSIQLFFIVIVATLLAVVVSAIALPIVYYIVYEYLGIVGPIFMISIPALKVMIYVLFCMLATLLFVSIRFSINNNIVSLTANSEVSVYKQDTRALKMPRVVYIIAYFMGFYAMYGAEFNAQFFLPSCIGAAGTYGIFCHVLPAFFYQIVDTRGEKPFLSIVLGNVIAFIQQMRTLALFIMVVVIVLSSVICAQTPYTSHFIICHIAFVVSNILLSSSLISRFKISFESRMQQYQTLYKLGLTTKEIIKVSVQEVYVVYGLLWVLGGIYLVAIIGAFTIHGGLDSINGIVVALEFFIPYAISQILVLLERKGRISRKWKQS